MGANEHELEDPAICSLLKFMENNTARHPRKMMGRFSFYTIFILLLLNIACQDPGTQKRTVENDTAMVLNILFDSTIRLPRLADQDLLFNNNPFHDSVIVMEDHMLNQYLPHYKFKFLSVAEIRKLQDHDKDLNQGPNFLEFRFWKKNDSVFGASVLNLGPPFERINASCEQQVEVTKTNRGFQSKVIHLFF